MSELTANDYEYWKTKKYWEATVAAGIVSGFTIMPPFYDQDDYYRIGEVLNASVVAFEKDKLIKWKGLVWPHNLSFHKRYCPAFCRVDKENNVSHIIWFSAIEYINWIVSENIIEIPEELMVRVNEQGDLSWVKEPNYVQKDILNCGYNKGVGRTILNIVITEHLKDYKFSPYWKHTEAAYLLEGHDPKLRKYEYGGDSPYIKMKYEAIKRASEIGDLHVATFIDGENCFRPSDVLKWANKAGFKIPEELNSLAQSDEDGDKDRIALNNGHARSFALNGTMITDPIAKDSSALFPCDPDTNWEDITITLISYEQVKIKTPQGEGKFNYAQIGMADGRNTDNKKRTWLLLMAFANYQGCITSDIIKNMNTIFPSSGQQDSFKKFMTGTKELNKHLKTLFGIEESIYIGQYRKMYKDEHSLKKYRPTFFKNEDTDDSIQKINRKTMINEALQKKGYATKINFVSTLKISNHNESEERSNFDLHLEDTNRMYSRAYKSERK